MGCVRKMFVHVTYNCNAKCIHCAVPHSKKNMPFDKYKKTVEAAEYAKVPFVIIGGGEPLLHPDIERMVIFASTRGRKVKIETNGLLIEEDFIKKLKNHIYQLNISLDSQNANVHNKIRRISVFDKVMETIDLCKKYGVDIAVWCVVMQHNIKQLSEYINFLIKKGVDKIAFLYATPVGNCFHNKEKILVEPHTYYKFVQSILNRNKRIIIRIAPFILPTWSDKNLNVNSSDLSCLIFEKSVIHIDPDGKVFPCVLLLSQPKWALTSVDKWEEFKELLSNPHSQKWTNIIDTIKNTMKKEVGNHTVYGCLGISSFQDSYNLEDYRFSYGYPVCPCRTIQKDW